MDERVLQGDRYLIAAGSDSPSLARTAGLRLPIVPVKGYSMTFVVEDTRVPRVPLVDRDRHFAVMPLDGHRLRIVGLAEFAGHDLRVDKARISVLRSLITGLLPACAPRLHTTHTQQWAGLRPMCADGRPMIGPSSLDNLFLNTGHGQLGWTLGAGSGRLVADLMMDCEPAVEPAAFAPARFVAPAGATV